MLEYDVNQNKTSIVQSTDPRLWLHLLETGPKVFPKKYSPLQKPMETDPFCPAPVETALT